MEIEGTLIKLLPLRSGTGEKGDWKIQEFIVKTKNGNYEDEICFSCNPDKVTLPADGMKLTVHFNLKSREYNEKWFTQANAWKIVVETLNKEQQQSSNTPPSDDLPF